MNLHQAIQKKWEEIDPQYLPIRKIFLERFKGIDLILLYGSCLSPSLRTETSTPDFFLVVNHYEDFYSKRSQALLNRWLPPNIYNLNLPSPFGPSKYCVVDWNRLERETLGGAKDTYHVGRFSKRMAFLYTRSIEDKKRIIHISAEAIKTVIRFILPELPERFPLDALILEALRWSYRGEVRLEKEDRAENIFKAEPSFYREVYREALKELHVSPQGGDLWQNLYPERERKARARETERFLKRSRFRHVARWPKYIFSQENYLTILLEKLERTHNIRIELTDREKRYPLLFCWKHFFRVWRNGLIR